MRKHTQLSMAHAHQIRIIGGTHRGRLLPVADLPGLRPTGNRMRETLFNWLQPVLPGAVCLDLFAGSGALGLEAASRGASKVIMLDTAYQVTLLMRKNLQSLQLSQVEFIQADAIQWLQRPACNPFDIVFLDPPFGNNLTPEVCRLLLQYRWLKAEAMLYLEGASATSPPPLPEGLYLVRESRMGQVWCGLVKDAGSIIPKELCDGV